jgi:hypothetical protein
MIPTSRTIRFAVAALAVFGALSSFTPAAGANEAFQCEAGARSLEMVMKEMGTVSKALAASLADATKNPESISGAKRLQELTAESLPLCVRKIDAMTDESAKAAEYAEYQRMMGELTDLSKELETELVASDNASAATTFGKIKTLQRAAHARFRG